MGTFVGFLELMLFLVTPKLYKSLWIVGGEFDESGCPKVAIAHGLVVCVVFIVYEWAGAGGDSLCRLGVSGENSRLISSSPTYS